jgi:hypothetical protein
MKQNPIDFIFNLIGAIIVVLAVLHNLFVGLPPWVMW